MRDCVKRIVEKSKGIISVADAKELIGEVDRAAKRKAAEGFDYDQSVKDILAQRMENTKLNIVKQKENIARNVVIKKSSTDKISQLIESGLSIKDAFRADLEGIESPIKGARDSLDIQKSAVESSYFSRFLGELNREGLLPVLNSKTLEDEIGKELWALSNKEPGGTRNNQAKIIADIIYKTRESQRKRLNAAGADISEVGGYIMPQRHDTAEMFKAGEDEWANFMLPLLDEKRSFGGDYNDLFDVLRGAYRAMITGIRLNDPTLKDSKLFQFTGPNNLAKRMSQSREIHFKDYESWKTWNEKYGMKDLNEGVLDAVRYDSHNIATMERYGTNPEAMLSEVADTIKKKYRDKAAAEGDAGIDSKLKSIIDGAMEKNMVPADPKLARIGSNIRAYQNVTKLGGAVISSITDMPMKSLEYKFQGKSWLSSTVQPFIDLAHGFKSKQERIEFASLLGVGMEGMVGDIGARFSAQDNLNNKAAKVQRMFFKLNGLAWWTDTHKLSMGKVMAHHLGLKKNIEFAKLDADTQRLFGNYSISEKDWDSLRKATVTMSDGRDYIFPEKVANEKLREKLAGYYINRTDAGIITPGARERRLSTFGTQRGTPIGEATRLIMQFKSFPITTVTKVWGRALYGKGKLDVPAMAYLMLTTMTFGYLAGAMKDLIKGKSPKDPTKIETAYAALAQGGGLGILGDILLNDSSGVGRSATQTLAGPTFGTFDDLFKIYSAGIRGGGSKRQAVMTGINALPFNNLFYTRAALDQIILLQMQEELNPGYLRRMEQNMRKTYGQELIYK
jgi:hypothetical protein